jgi:4-aminobutyrate aminotransferase
MMTDDPCKQPKVDLSEGDSNLSQQRRHWIETAIDATSAEWLERDARAFLHQSLSTPCLNVLKTCQDSFIEDLQDRRYFDFHGNSVHQIGFAHPQVIAAIKYQLDTLAFCTRRYTNIAAIELAEKLIAITPDPLGKVLFAPGGTTAVGMAMKLARAATGRFKTISMWDAFHGASLDAMSISGEAMFRQDVGPLLTGSQHVPPADPYRCIWNPEGTCEGCDLKCAAYIEYVLDKEGDVGAVIAEPVRNTAVNPPPPGYWQAVRNACDRHGALLILDETAVCLGRTGSMFACQTFEVTPDILTIGKGIGGGVIPFAAMIARSDLDIAPKKAIGHYTHEKNPVAAAAGLATIKIIETQNLSQRAADLGEHVMERLRAMQNDHPLIGDVRGVGLVLGVDLVQDRQTKNRAVTEAEQLMYECLQRGLSFKTSQGSFIPLSPPLTISQKELDQAIDILETALTIIEKNR